MEMRDGPGDETTNMTQTLGFLKEAMGNLPEILVLIRRLRSSHNPRILELGQCHPPDILKQAKAPRRRNLQMQPKRLQGRGTTSTSDHGHWPKTNKKVQKTDQK